MTDFKAIASSLEQRGFCVIPEFLSRDEIDFLVEEFDASPDYSPPTKTKHAARHLGDKPVAGQTGALHSTAMGRKETFQRIRPRMEAFAQGVTGAKAALYQIIYLQTPVINLPFHQDHDQFFVTEYNRTHLNYWIPLVKPSRTEAGLRVIPWDRLGEKSPRRAIRRRRSTGIGWPAIPQWQRCCVSRARTSCFSRFFKPPRKTTSASLWGTSCRP